ncbi:MAG: exodeoxyribonuclease VII large subunit [Bacteroidetes bacterium RBG_13_46_8]|nr:MAG: exodeoxyribonuclease VII large subunit [Bacteroidetes bacterium RBG_13_46_8]
MPENPLTLFELNGLIKDSIKKSFPDSFWVVAEISELKVNVNGHCYLELIEKDAESEMMKARARATIWSSAFRMIRPYFETTVHTALSPGLKIMVKASVEFHELYGLSLNITDIEPSYTLGEMARQKQDVIDRLIREGVFDLNKQQELHRLPRKIAVISSQTAAGYGDFHDQLLHNPYGYKFYIRLFPAIMQGEEAEASIVSSMERVFRHEDFFDALVIIRGGGAQSDLSCFNGYWLASHIAQFSLPVLTGIGHEQDETVADMVAHTRLKTPTAVAEFLLAKFQEEDSFLYELSASLAEATRDILHDQGTRLMKLAFLIKPLIRSAMENSRKRLAIDAVILKNASRKVLSGARNASAMLQFRVTSSSKQFLLRNSHRISLVRNNLKFIIPSLFQQESFRLEMLASKNLYNDPQHVLKRGYSITLFRGKPLKNAGDVKEGDEIDTVLQQGRLKSQVTGNNEQ